MNHDKLLAKIDEELSTNYADECGNFPIGLTALRAVVELHIEDIGTPIDDPISVCDWCKVAYPCPTIQAIEKELQ
jgi:hypothetical protein